MTQIISIVLGSLLVSLPGLCFANAGMASKLIQKQDAEKMSEKTWLLKQEAFDMAFDTAFDDVELGGWHHRHHYNLDQPASAPAPAEAEVKLDADHAHHAAKVAKHAAKVANEVAEHSVKVTGHAKKALKHALGALHAARVDTSGLDQSQKDSLKKAEGHLREATKTAEFGKLKEVEEEKDLQKEKMQDDLDKSTIDKSEKEQLLDEIQEIRKMLKDKNVNDKEINKALDDLEDELNKSDGSNIDEIKAEIERLRDLVDKMEPEAKDKEFKVTGMQPLDESAKAQTDDSATPVEEKGIDIDTQMPYGDLEPFGREDTAQELTEKSIKESDDMVDQLERAEVAEEKRAVFRALTRLRGAAITSYDGVARSQSGNIDEYNKVHKWRKSHPLHHLADEESDVTKWAFPDNADLLQKTWKQ